MSRDCCVALPLLMPRAGLQFVIVMFLDHTHLLSIFELIVLYPKEGFSRVLAQLVFVSVFQVTFSFVLR